MNLKFNFLWGAGCLLLLSGCVDDSYDLSDIDTTSEFKVNDLVLPINLDPVVLSDIIRVEEGDKLKEVTINGNTFYAVEQSGDFHSDGIDINGFSADSEPMSDKTARFALSNPSGLKRKAAPGALYFLMEPVQEDLTYKSVDPIDGSVRDLTKILYKDLVFNIRISTSSLPSSVITEISDYEMYMPKGLTVTRIKAGDKTYDASVYNPQTGLMSLQDAFSFANNSTTIEITTTAIDLSYYDGAFKYDSASESGSFSLVSEFNIERALMSLTGLETPLEEIDYTVQYDLGSLNATSIMGSIQYDLEGTGLDIEPIDMADMPDFLDDPETDLMLSNPQIYLQLLNPIGHYGLSYQSTLDILAIRDNGEVPFTSPLIKVPANKPMQNFLLAPEPARVSDIPAGYENPERLVYNGLGNILSGEGLPKSLDIKLLDPMIPEQPLTAPFELDQSIEGMEGFYMFLAPLSLKENSTIVKTVDGWWTEDLSDLYIDYLTIDADATNGLPTGVEVKVFAINPDGKQISTEGSVALEENAVSKGISIRLQGIDGQPFHDLDGIKLYVIAGSNDGQPLAPNQTITLDNIKAKVTGNYTREL